MTAYYNENDKRAAATLRELIRVGVIAPGDVDERSIEDVRPIELAGYTQRHFFAGFGVWSYALRLAGWPDNRAVVTGSCPCQPFSVAGKRAGVTDKRHLWPAMFWHVRFGQPCAIFGEQVASKDGLAWLDTVSTDLEAEGYAVGTVDLCAAGFGAPHIRQRLFWVADTGSFKRQPQSLQHAASILRTLDGEGGSRHEPSSLRTTSGGMGHAIGARLERFSGDGDADGSWSSPTRPASEAGDAGRMADTADDGHAAADGLRAEIEPSFASGTESIGELARGGDADWSNATKGHWGGADWLFCRDGRWRPVEPGTSPLAHGAAERVGRLRGYGNAINAEVAAGFIRAAMKEMV